MVAELSKRPTAFTLGLAMHSSILCLTFVSQFVLNSAPVLKIMFCLMYCHYMWQLLAIVVDAGDLFHHKATSVKVGIMSLVLMP